MEISRSKAWKGVGSDKCSLKHAEYKKNASAKELQMEMFWKQLKYRIQPGSAENSSLGFICTEVLAKHMGNAGPPGLGQQEKKLECQGLSLRGIAS